MNTAPGAGFGVRKNDAPWKLAPVPPSGLESTYMDARFTGNSVASRATTWRR